MPERSGAERIADERRRQIEAEGWTAEHDDFHWCGELAAAAACYAQAAARQAKDGTFVEVLMRIPDGWPENWAHNWWKPANDPVRNLEKAGALIAAEIDRLLRMREAPTADGKNEAAGVSIQTNWCSAGHNLIAVEASWQTIHCVNGSRLEHKKQLLVCGRCGWIFDPFPEMTEGYGR
ncbi:MAG TPA: hypothetical protein VF392_00460 [Terracidiphilus sp.]